MFEEKVTSTACGTADPTPAPACGTTDPNPAPACGTNDPEPAPACGTKDPEAQKKSKASITDKLAPRFCQEAFLV